MCNDIPGSSRHVAQVLRYLQRKSLMDEGAMTGDPQDYVTFGLLALVVVGAAYGALQQQG